MGKNTVSVYRRDHRCQELVSDFSTSWYGDLGNEVSPFSVRIQSKAVVYLILIVDDMSWS